MKTINSVPLNTEKPQAQSMINLQPANQGIMLYQLEKLRLLAVAALDKNKAVR